MPILQVFDGNISGTISSISNVSGNISDQGSISGNLSMPVGASNGLPPGGSPGDILMKITDANYAAGWMAPASSAEEDNTRPITSAAVYTEIGNINALLATI